MKLPTLNYRAIALIAIAASVMGLVMSPASAAGFSPSGTYMQGQHHGGNFLSNQTLITAAAQTLGVSASDLTTALTPPAQGHFNLTNAAATLSTTSGITITPAQLMAALGMHQGQMRNVAGQGQRFGGNILSNQTLITAAAQTLGVSASDLTAALTPPAQGHFNLTNAAAQLSTTSGITITPAQLMAALGMHQGGMITSNQWAQGGSFRSHHAGFGNRTAWHTSSGTSVPGSS